MNIRDWSLFMWGGGGGEGEKNHGVGQAYFFLEKRGGPKENFTMIEVGSLIVNVLMVLLFCLITFTQVFQNMQKTLSFLMVNTFQST